MSQILTKPQEIKFYSRLRRNPEYITEYLGFNDWQDIQYSYTAFFCIVSKRILPPAAPLPLNNFSAAHDTQQYRSELRKELGISLDSILWHHPIMRISPFWRKQYDDALIKSTTDFI